MASERKRYYIKGNGGRFYGFAGAIDIYDGIKSILGVKDQSANQGDDVVTGMTGEMVPKLVLALAADSSLAPGVQAGAASDITRHIKVYCDPSQLEAAMSQLPGKDIKGKKIMRAYLPRKRTYSY